jgi:hypothetical protein
MSFSLFKQKGARTPEEVVRHTKGALLAWAELQEHPPDVEVKALEKVGTQRSMWIDSPPFRSLEHAGFCWENISMPSNPCAGSQVVRQLVRHLVG